MKAVSFALAISATILTSAYILWMYKRIFYGVVPETLKNVRDSSKYVLITMGILASLTLILGLYPDLLYKPIIAYVENLYDESPNELKPVKIGAASSENNNQTNTTLGNGASEEQSGGVNNVTNTLGTPQTQKTHLISGNHLVSYVTI